MKLSSDEFRRALAGITSLVGVEITNAEGVPQWTQVATADLQRYVSDLEARLIKLAAAVADKLP